MEITKEQAIQLAGSNFWESMSPREIAVFQMNTKCLCMPFTVFHEALEKALERPVWTHELGVNADGIRKELNGEVSAPTMEEIINMIPAEKRMIVVTDSASRDRATDES